MSTDWVTQCVSVSLATYLHQIPSQDARKSLIHATQILVDPMLTVFLQEILPPAGVQLVTREIHLCLAEREIVNMTENVPRAWHVSTTIARTHALELADKIQIARLGIIDQFAAVLRVSEVIL